MLEISNEGDTAKVDASGSIAIKVARAIHDEISAFAKSNNLTMKDAASRKSDQGLGGLWGRHCSDQSAVNTGAV